jgi:immune inhibitor A
MKKKIVIVIAVVALALAAGLVPALTAASGTTDIETAVKSLGMFSDGKWTQHLRVPRDDQVVRLLEEEGIPLQTEEQKRYGVELFRQEWALRNPTTPNPEKLEELLEAERVGESGALATPVMQSLVVPMEFPDVDETFDWYGTDVTFAGPLHNQIPAPGPRDNNTIWYEDASAALYEELYFGVGPYAGVIVDHPNLGEVDLRGYTMANYYLEQSQGTFCPEGAVYPSWLMAQHCEAYYGADNQTGSNHNIRADELVREAVDAINADDPTFRWADYDSDGDGIVDNFTVIHAGMGQEAGGGELGDFAIWSHASAVDYPTGYLACPAGTNGATQDIYVREYSMDPENIDVGVIAEEYGHAAFGLPDIYTTDYQGSPSNWTIMESGSWNGILGGMTPAPFSLYFRYIVGWADPVEIPYDKTKVTTAKVGQLCEAPLGTEDGLKIDLPDQVVQTDNLAGTGNGWWSTRSDLADFYLAHDFDLTGTTSPVFSFGSYWSFEEDYDYGYFEVSTDGGATWQWLADEGGYMVDDGMGAKGLNGEWGDVLSFDLSAYAGSTVSVRLHYVSDVGVQWAGWWADDFALTDGATTLFSDDCESGAGAWTTNAFEFVPQTNIYPLYYLVEWRNNSGFDKGLAYPYQTVYSDDDEWEVDRSPYTVPGMLLWVRNGAYDFDYTLSDSFYNAPSYGPKHALLVVDSHFWPLTWDSTQYVTGVNRRISARCQPSNATFTLQETTPFTLRLGYDPLTGEWLDEPTETKYFAPQPAVSQFHDSLGYYPGLYLPDDWSGLYWWQVDASAVVPAEDSYSTRLTWTDKSPCYDLYGLDMGDTVLGSGDPRDGYWMDGNGVQYGVNIAVTGKASNGSWGKISVWNAKTLAKLYIQPGRTTVQAGKTLVYTLKVQNLGPAPQTFSVYDAIPDNTTFVSGKYYNSADNAIEWQGTIGPLKTTTLSFMVKVKAGTPSGTLIFNEGYLWDDASGASAVSVTRVR